MFGEGERQSIMGATKQPFVEPAVKTNHFPQIQSKKTGSKIRNPVASSRREESRAMWVGNTRPPNDGAGAQFPAPSFSPRQPFPLSNAADPGTWDWRGQTEVGDHQNTTKGGGSKPLIIPVARPPPQVGPRPPSRARRCRCGSGTTASPGRCWRPAAGSRTWRPGAASRTAALGWEQPGRIDTGGCGCLCVGV